MNAGCRVAGHTALSTVARSCKAHIVDDKAPAACLGRGARKPCSNGGAVCHTQIRLTRRVLAPRPPPRLHM